MTTFDEFKYERPDVAAISTAFRALLADFAGAATAERQDELMAEIAAIRNRIETMASIVEIRHTCDVEDAFYEKENDFMDEADPLFEGLKSEFYAALAASPFKAELARKWGPQLFRLAELQMKTWKPEIVEDLQAENRLASEYVKLKASARIAFEGQERNLSEMHPFTESPDRGLRRRAQAAISGFYAEHEEEFDRIYDGLVKVRHRIALKLGFDSFVPLAYARLGRSDYDAAMVGGYRRQVLASVVPLAGALRARQGRRLGLEKLTFCDEALDFSDGNAAPLGDSSWIVDKGLSMFAEMSPETGEFFREMTERKLLDLETRKSKAAGGYCSYMPDEGAPFIFANFNGTSDDVDTFAHEAGHAFQVHSSGHLGLPEYYWPTLEACEIHSMSMEFFAWPWAEGFFGQGAARYRFRHLSAGILFVPYGVLVDEFQHWVYEHPDATPAERKAVWREKEEIYLPWRDYDGDAFLERGGYWYRQGHIFEDPFYYIDYTLAQMSAYEFWGKARSDRA
ncbi:MAG: M3 family oligoendopeptidase, partial [Spirochaetaceae bacterium]|nr:M3 family oligoendopeptidase [Spirochaetaceae bacterium]